MACDTGKTIREGDPEVSEAIDFAAYYAEHIPAQTGFRPYGTVVVASPWNFPLSIPAGGVLAALAAGNAVILKPAPEAVAVGGELAEALWEGGVSRVGIAVRAVRRRGGRFRVCSSPIRTWMRWC